MPIFVAHKRLLRGRNSRHSLGTTTLLCTVAVANFLLHATLITLHASIVSISLRIGNAGYQNTERATRFRFA